MKDIEGEEGHQQEALYGVGVVLIDVIGVPAHGQFVEAGILLTANALCQEYLDEYQPQGPTQRDLVEEMVAAKWRQRRCTLIETGILILTMGPHGR